MKYEYAFFDVDSLELSPRGKTFVCHPQTQSISDKLFEVYGIISAIPAPLVFSVDVNRNIPDNNIRRDYLSIPVSDSEKEWKKLVPDWRKYYIERDASDDNEKTAIFNNNKNAVDCVKSVEAKEWIVFGSGIEHGIDHVISTLLGISNTVKFVPELITPGESESKELLESYFSKWEEQGATPITFNRVALMVKK